MFRRSVVAVGLLAAAVCPSACSSDSSANISIAPSLLFPKALLDNVTKLTLTVVDSNGGAVDCGSDGAPTGDASHPILTKDLTSNGCANGAKFCGDVQIVESNDVLVFGAAGFDSTGAQVATGCGKAAVNQDALPVQITMKRFIPSSVCGDGVIGATEQCEGGSDTDTVCDASCHTKEILLSGGHAANSTVGTVNGTAGDKKNPSFVWPTQSGAPGRFVALFGDSSPPSVTKVTMRVLGDDLHPYAAQGAEFANYSFFMPHTNPDEGFPPSAGPNNQYAPTGATVGGSYYIAYQDDSAGSLDIYLRQIDSTFVASQADGLAVNGAEAGKQDTPSMAASSGGALLIAWQDDAAGAIKARPYNTSVSPLSPSGLGTTATISSGTGNVGVVVASTGTGFVCVWQSGNDIKVRTIGADGTPLSAEQKVNDATHSGAQLHPWVAGLSDGRFAVVWNEQSSQNIFLQRFTASAQPVAGDQASSINNLVTGGQNTPTIAASASGSFVAAWVDSTSGAVRARFIGGSSGFLFDNVDGQSDEFQASLADSRTRANPAAVIGGAGPYVTIGWEDTTADANAGIYTRRFPLPSN